MGFRGARCRGAIANPGGIRAVSLGPLASNVFEATGFVRTLPELTRPDIQVVFQAARRNTNTFPLPLGHGFAINIVGLYPKSRGRVLLSSNDPCAAPVVDANLLTHPDDLLTLLRGLRIGRRVAHAPAFARYRAHEVKRVLQLPMTRHWRTSFVTPPLPCTILAARVAWGRMRMPS